jgi:hypothetical protein
MRTFKIPHCLPNGPQINVSISNSDCDFSQWLAENKIKDGSPSILGFDCEWRPNFRPGSPENKVALIQVLPPSVISYCVGSFLPDICSGVFVAIHCQLSVPLPHQAHSAGFADAESC